MEAIVTALQERVAALEDERAIRETLSRYGYMADMGRSEEWVALFTEDGAMDLSLGDGTVRYAGHAELLAFITDPNGHKLIEGRTLHLMVNNPRIQVDGDHATAEAYHLLLVVQDGEMVVRNGTVNRWTFRREDGAWRIVECLRRRPGTEGFDRVLVTER